MTDGTSGWTSPSGGGPQRPRSGEQVPGWTPPPQPAAPPPTAYRPPPRRGLVPLHPLSFGQLLGASFGVIRWNPRATIVPALAVALLQTVLVFSGLGLLALQAVDRVQRASTDADRQQILAGVIGGGVLFGLVTLVVTVVTSALLQGMLVTVIARAAAGERVGIGTALRAAWRRALPLIGISLLLGALQVVAIGVLALLVVLFAQVRGVGLALAIATGVLGGLGLIVLSVFLAIKLATVPSVIVLERTGVFAAIRRSWVLLRGSFWRTFGLIALVFLMVSAASQLVTLPFSVLGGAIGGLLAPNEGGGLQSADSVLALIASTLPAAIVGVVVSGIGQVAQVAALVLVYLDLRMRREGLDLELQRFVEEGGSGPFERSG